MFDLIQGSTMATRACRRLEPEDDDGEKPIARRGLRR